MGGSQKSFITITVFDHNNGELIDTILLCTYKMNYERVYNTFIEEYKNELVKNGVYEEYLNEHYEFEYKVYQFKEILIL
jgi:hypothetical protein